MSTLSLESPAPNTRITTLEKLRGAARALFVELGYHDTRPQDIARRAGVANGTFYLHFSDKQQAFLDFAEQAQNELIEVMEQRLAGVTSHRERWKVICTAVIDFGANHPGLLQAAFLDPVFVAPRDDSAWRMYDRFGHLLSQVLAEESTSVDYDFELISHGICGMLRHAMIYAARSDISQDQLIENMSTFIDRGLKTS